ALMVRYAPLVFGVCERLLRSRHDAEDAFQATFFVLVRRAKELDGRASLANWLYGVAYRTALKAKALASLRRAHERRAAVMCEEADRDEVVWRDLRPLLDEELNRLPAKYRAPMVLCGLQGKTHLEAAQELGWPSGS